MYCGGVDECAVSNFKMLREPEVLVGESSGPDWRIFWNHTRCFAVLGLDLRRAPGTQEIRAGLADDCCREIERQMSPTRSRNTSARACI